MQGDSVRFRVQKGSKFLFKCEIAHKDALPEELQQHVVRIDEMGVLRDAEVAITKRLHLVEVERMIACCRQHPPQALITPIDTKDLGQQAAFSELAQYLQQRERAGVGSFGPGVLVLLIPLGDANNYMRCQIVNTQTTVGEIGAQVSASVFIPAADQVPLAAKPTSVMPDELQETQIGSAQDGTSIQSQWEVNVDVYDTNQQDLEESGSIHDQFDDLRREHAAFNAFYHHVLLEWSTKPSDTNSALELQRHT